MWHVMNNNLYWDKLSITMNLLLYNTLDHEMDERRKLYENFGPRRGETDEMFRNNLELSLATTRIQLGLVIGLASHLGSAQPHEEILDLVASEIQDLSMAMYQKMDTSNKFRVAVAGDEFFLAVRETVCLQVPFYQRLMLLKDKTTEFRVAAQIEFKTAEAYMAATQPMIDRERKRSAASVNSNQAARKEIETNYKREDELRRAEANDIFKTDS